MKQHVETLCGVLTLQHSSPVRAGLDDEEVCSDPCADENHSIQRFNVFNALKSTMHKKYYGIFVQFVLMLKLNIYEFKPPQTFLIVDKHIHNHRKSAILKKQQLQL